MAYPVDTKDQEAPSPLRGVEPVIYLFTSDRVLSRLYEEGRQGRVARRMFVEGRTDNETEVIRVARGEDSLLVADIKDTPPKHYADYAGREYQCFLMVPIRTNKRSYGFLAVDSDRPYTLTKVDIGFATLMAYLLGSALALLGEDYPRLGSFDPEGQEPESGATE
jgi:signal transduction protein with GAF and PtsI domain